MFTGLVREIGEVLRVDRDADGARIWVRCELAGELADGDSVSTSGVCLTVASLEDGAYRADVINQTLRVSSLGSLETGSRVNLEPALRAGEALGGHIVQGHVDGLARVTESRPDGFSTKLELELPRELRHLVVEHGSITLDGVSLTISALTRHGLEVSLIPETLERTTLGTKRVGDELNVEVDVVARYVERMSSAWENRGR
ncbi:riboflavin synthase [Thermoleophilia bacterium SCSIO 60948]|nr:riboflavin synthase [Thermoleophilia bacterium SCSIO 60948]